MASSDPNIGRILDNRYELIQLIGKGAMGRVYLAKHAMLGGAVAVKFLSQNIINQKMRDRFESEARTCAQLGQKSIHIVRVSDFGCDEQDVPFYVMEYLQGESLSAIIQPHTLPLPRFLGIIRQTSLGLKAAHEGLIVNGQLCPIVHRDIKPSNILVSPDETVGELAKVLDFGIAKLLQEDSSQTSGFMGTLAYASPEQMEGKEIVDHRSDIYSLGIMMFQMLTGKLPIFSDTHTFGGWYQAHCNREPKRFESIIPDHKLPKTLTNLVYDCLAKQPGDRPQSMQDILDILEPLEQRFGQGRNLGHRIQSALNRLPVAGESSTTVKPELPTVDTICQMQTWPTGKPIQRIVFPQVINANNMPIVTLWVMLPKAEIEQLQFHRLYTRTYRNFLCAMSPHPMVMWLTAIHNSNYAKTEKPRWLPCFLDLKSAQGDEITRILGDRGEYRILLFALEDPQRCSLVIQASINAAQCALMRQWVVTSRAQTASQSPAMSKDVLRAEYERLKPKVDTDFFGVT
jgi:eukaryotic-like serine/threonine-protein kinase